MFVDQIKIFARAGKGGDGACSFRREAFVPRGGPDGGDGGRGGSIILQADPHTDALTQFHYEPIVRAKHGENGKGKQCYGKSAKNTILRVPVGTLIYRLPDTASPFTPKLQDWEIEEAEAEAESEGADLATEEANEEEGESPVVDTAQNSGARVGQAAAAAANEKELIADLNRPGMEFVLCEGGKGGLGNVHFKSSRNQVPRQFTPGKEGEEGYFLLELRSIADAGLVGYPNAGKSTLLTQISAAHPKVAPYPFTTLNPIIGMVDFGGFRRAPVADIPGLIEGAHENVGLGHEFLRHIMRCRVLLFVIDMSGSEGRSPIDDLANLRRELDLYDPTLSARPWFVAANKMDDPQSEEQLGYFRQRYPKLEIVPISAGLGEGIEELKTVLASYLFTEEPEQEQTEPATE